MGIPGILKEIGKGERVALAKLAIEHFERSKRPYRIAIDAAIWNFQNQAGQGGKNPALRTLFYRLLKLLALPIQPIFVYDGKNKPLTKRGKTVSRYGTCISNETSKKLIQGFRFPCHNAPGEAEAECAMLQRRGLVDAVMSQDVDAIMFGSAVTLRDWSKEASKHNKTPTHVSVLDLSGIQRRSRLDPEGMILVALLSGGDYDEAGVPGFGPGLACEAAKAGFGTDLLELVRTDDEDGLNDWRERLQHELETNESGFFKTKHKSVKVPDTFPDRRILGYYMNPTVSLEKDLPALQQKWHGDWQMDIDVCSMRNYVADTFDWRYKPGAWKFVRVMAPALFAHNLRAGIDRTITAVDQITERRTHFVSDGIPELRVTAIPAEIVGIDLEAEDDSPEYLDMIAADEEDGVGVEATDKVNARNIPSDPCKSRKTPPWLPFNPEKMWIAETLVEAGAREHVAEWHRIQREIQSDPKKFATRKCRKAKNPMTEKHSGGMQEGIMRGYVISTVPAGSKDSSTVKSAAPVSTQEKRTTGGRRVARTPIKPRIQRPVPSSSPNLQDYFKTTKGSPSRIQTQKHSDLLEQLIDVPTNDGAGQKLTAEKHSRPSTSTSTSSCVIPNEMGNVSNSRLMPRKDAPPPNVRGSATSALRSQRRKDVKSSPKKSGRDPSNAILIKSSPPIGVASNVAAKEAVRRDLREAAPSDNPSSRLAPPAKRVVKRPDPRGMPEADQSPCRVRRPIESFFAPYIAAAEQRSLAAGGGNPRLNSQVKLDGLAVDSSSQSAIAFASSRIHAVPRSSLPGTWKETDGIRETTASRLSIIDLTEG